ncbi:hypothetical protein K505DRAFT_321118 [Melanomma pulvis-pyrius CBS 109.77]|uniref:Uncharacterized protein n=1 Tax=Melanomma pulvis-pyrius CBS 109.77 TaxID=1314802 RepID=A0A6A6XSF4_9PLEO|nr:hypothetical protein K505DRAFT_321118 [Melanomma pulvis-pyrius CBS 109.77]
MTCTYIDPSYPFILLCTLLDTSSPTGILLNALSIHKSCSAQALSHSPLLIR